ncbi:MAG: hypothetical protein R3270_00990 [Gammaproteobacteria bacterium]|nr:hypothetical protein [Gammaproteobacteria bacterium]
MDDKWFRHALVAMVAGLAWFLAAEFLFRFGVQRISPDIFLQGPSPLLRMWIMHLSVYFIAVIVASIVCVRLFLVFCREATLGDLLPGVALAGTLRVMVSMDSGFSPYPWWFEGLRLLFVVALPLAFAMWMLARTQEMPD